jgi:hypothetical protein
MRNAVFFHMARKLTFPEQIQGKLVAGTLAALDTRRIPEETRGEQLRRVIEEWLKKPVRRRD